MRIHLFHLLKSKILHLSSGRTGAVLPLFLTLPLILLCLPAYLAKSLPQPGQAQVQTQPAPEEGHARSDLAEIRFPKEYIAFSGYTAEETRTLWDEAEDQAERYTRCALNEDDSVSVFVTADQQALNIRIYEAALSGWMIQCENKGLDVSYAKDCRAVTFRTDSPADFEAATGDVRAVLCALSCLQFASGEQPGDWSLQVTVTGRGQKAPVFMTYSLP